MYAGTSAAQSLENITLKSGWKVLNKVEKKPFSSGGFFSVCYLVEKDGKTAFLKALDFIAFFQLNGGTKNIIDVVKEMTEAFVFERDILQMCKDKNLTKVSTIIDSGEENLTGHLIPNVPYLIFELAEGDVRAKLNFSKNLDNAWKLHSLRDIAVGLQQLHSVEISHQDLKPSNVFVYNDKVSKIGDLGRSLCKDYNAPHSTGVFTGDINYAPPEFLYNYYEADWNKRVFSTDMFLFGSMVVFYFTGVTMNNLIFEAIDENFRWNKWRGSFDDVKPYLLDAFTNSMEKFETTIPDGNLKKDLRLLVERLCYPFPDKRGHPKNNNETYIGNPYSFERFISNIDLLYKRAEYNLIKSA